MMKLYQLLFYLFHAAIGESNDTCSGGRALSPLPNDETIAVTIDGRSVVTKTIYGEKDEGDLQMIYELGISFKPVDLGYQVKLNDQISGCMPFRENVRFEKNHLFRCA